jgi:hypothetical protein
VPIKVFSPATIFEIGPGETKSWWWNNATPENSVWSANAIPQKTGSSDIGFAQNTQLEVTRLWRVFKVTEKAPPNSQISDLEIETEIHYEVKNLGNKKAKFKIMFSVATP